MIRFRSRRMSRCSELVSMLSIRPLRRRFEVAVGGFASRSRKRDLLLKKLHGPAGCRRHDEDGERQLDGSRRLSRRGRSVAQSPLSEKRSRFLIFLVASSDQVLVDDVADMLEVGREGDDLHRPGGFPPSPMFSWLTWVRYSLIASCSLSTMSSALADLGRRDCGRRSSTPSTYRAASAPACRPSARFRGPLRRSRAAACRAPSRPDSAASTARRRRSGPAGSAGRAARPAPPAAGRGPPAPG